MVTPYPGGPRSLGRPLLGRALGPRQIQGRVYQSNVGERLWEVADQSAGPGVVLLAQQAEVVPEAEQPLEEGRGLLAPAEEGQIVREPEGTWEERPLPGRQA